MGIIEKIKMVFALIYSIAEVDNVEQQFDIESLKEQDIIDAVMEEFRRFSPNGAHALIDERDAYIAHQLILLKAQRPKAGSLPLSAPVTVRESTIISNIRRNFRRLTRLQKNQNPFPGQKYSDLQ